MISACLDNYDSLRNAQSTGHGLYDEHNYAQDENIYDEPSDMNYHESDFQQTFSHSDDKFNLKYEEGVGDGTLHDAYTPQARCRGATVAALPGTSL